jgi:hypothetical protein
MKKSKKDKLIKHYTVKFYSKLAGNISFVSYNQDIKIIADAIITSET